MIAGLVLAAGGSSRYGEPKQLAMLNGRPLLEHALETQLAVPAIERDRGRARRAKPSGFAAEATSRAPTS